MSAVVAVALGKVGKCDVGGSFATACCDGVWRWYIGNTDVIRWCRKP